MWSLRSLALLGMLLPYAGGALAQTAGTPPVNPENPRSAVLWLTVSFVDTAAGRPAPGRAVIAARLAPGIDASGRPHPVKDSTLTLLGRGLTPSGKDWSGALLYGADIPLTTADFGRALGLVAPVVSGVSAPPSAGDWRGIGQLDPDQVAIGAGEPLRLHLVASDSAPTLKDGERWNLLLTAAGADTLMAMGEGRAPNTLVVPASLLPRAASGRLAARFTDTITPALNRPADDAYTIFPSVSTTLQWTVSVPVASASPARASAGEKP